MTTLFNASTAGAHCKRNIPNDTVIMRIPKQYLITVEMGKACPIGRKMVAGRYVLLLQRSGSEI